jgi:hypothetical protein
MKPPLLALIILSALLAGCGAEDGSAVNLAATKASAEQESLAPVNYAPGALNAPLSSPPKEPPRIEQFIPVRAGQYVEWTYRNHQTPVGYRMGDISVIVRGPESPALDYSGSSLDPIIRQIRVKAPGRPEYVHELDTGAGLPTRLTYGKFDRAGTPYLLVNTFTGGAHCCGVIELFIVHPNRIEQVDLDQFQEGFPIPDVRDFDGDGLVDFMVDDRGFMNRFTSWAEGRRPPVILNVVDGKVVDVSARPGFRPLFAKAARRLRTECLHPDGISPNGACAAYVAAAGRAGNFKKAWAEMLAAHDPDSKEGLLCRLSLADESCPSDDLTYATYPDALRAFLREQGFPAT